MTLRLMVLPNDCGSKFKERIRGVFICIGEGG